MARGGRRLGAGGKSTWNYGKTKTIRVPEALAEQVLEFARQLDEGEVKISRQDENLSLSLKKPEAIIEPETGSKVLDLSGIKLRQQNGILAVYLEDLVKAGYELSPPSVSQLVSARLQKLEIDRRLKYGNNSKDGR